MSHRFNRLSLFKTILLWVALSIVAYTALSAVWGEGSGWQRILSGWQLGAGHDPLDRIKVTLTAIGGIGAVGYLVIKYRERSAFERGEADEKLVRAVQQLGDNSQQVRIAGVYALADIADTYEGPYHQRVVDILCGYLRTDRLVRDTNGDPRYAVTEEGDLEDSPLSSDGAIESTILSVLSSHLKSTIGSAKMPSRLAKTFPGPWSHCTLDLHGATITELFDFSGTHINILNSQETRFTRNVRFQDATFTGRADFWSSTFAQDANFDRASFEEDADFDNVTFSQHSTFQSANFMQNTSFQKSTFKQISSFQESKFLQTAVFQNTTFEGWVSFKKSTFKKSLHIFQSFFEDATTFDNSSVKGEAHISSSHLNKDSSFKDCIFSEAVYIKKTTFEGGLNFETTKFLGDIAFESSQITGNASLQKAKFHGVTQLRDVTFSSEVNLRETTFEREVDFKNVTFGGYTNFENATFLSDTRMTTVHFNESVNLLNMTVSGNLSVKNSTFIEPVDFKQSYFRGYLNFQDNVYATGIGFSGARFNSSLKESRKMRFPDGIKLDSEGAPVGSRWIKFRYAIK